MRFYRRFNLRLVRLVEASGLRNSNPSNSNFGFVARSMATDDTTKIIKVFDWTIIKGSDDITHHQTGLECACVLLNTLDVAGSGGLAAPDSQKCT